MVLGSGIRDPGSGKTYSGSRIQGSKKAPDPESATLRTNMSWIHNTAKRPVLRIHDILGWVRGSMPLTNGSGSSYFRH